MALIIETGAGIAGAESYQTVAGFAAWAVSMMGETLTGTEATQEAALRRAYVYMGGLDWLPDTYATFGGTIPDAIKAAQSAFARGELATPGYLSPDVTLSGKKVLTGLGSLTWQVQGAPNTVEAARPIVSLGFDYLKPYLRSLPGSNTKVSFVGRA